MKAETIHRSHHRLLRLNASKHPSKQDERILVVGIHVLQDLACSISQRVGLRLVILRGRDPAHHPEAAHVVLCYRVDAAPRVFSGWVRSEEHTSELQSL